MSVKVNLKTVNNSNANKTQDDKIWSRPQLVGIPEISILSLEFSKHTGNNDFYNSIKVIV
jgi:hypothetical protein